MLAACGESCHFKKHHAMLKAGICLVAASAIMTGPDGIVDRCNEILKFY
jgi:hypothetical protein